MLGYATVYKNILPLGICFLSFCYEIWKILNISCCSALVVVCGLLPNHTAHFLPRCTAPPEAELLAIYFSENLLVFQQYCNMACSTMHLWHQDQ